MKGKVRWLWMQIHTYIACFFLPFLFLYVLSGVLYLFEVEGKSFDKVSQEVHLPQGWPSDEQQALTLVFEHVKQHQRLPLPPEYFVDKENEWLSWYGYKQEVTLYKTSDPKVGRLEMAKHDFVQQMMLVHKGHAGLVLLVLGIGLGLSLLTTMLSGVILAISMPKMKRTSLACVGIGSLLLIVLFVFGY